MAMRPEVRRRAIVLIVVGILQWAFVTMALNGNWWPMTKGERILTFCVSSFGGAWMVMVGLLYMALKGNKNEKS